MPARAGQAPEAVQQAAIEYAQLLRRVDDAWKPDARPPEYYEQVVKELTEFAADIVVLNLLKIMTERFGEEAATEAAGVDSQNEKAVNTWLEEAGARLGLPLLEALQRSAPAEEWVKPLEQDLVAGTLQEVEAEYGDAIGRMSEEEYGQVFSARYSEYWRDNYTAAVVHQAEGIARLYLEALNATELPLADLAALLQPEASRDSSTLAIGTGKISRVLQEGIIKRTDREPLTRAAALTQKEQYLLRVDARLNPADHPALLSVHPRRQEEILQDMQLTLAGWKEHNAALLKLHLDLSNQAHRHSLEQDTDMPVFRYDLAAALERQGYAFNSKRRGYDPRTMQNLRQRIEALYSHRVTAWSETRTGGRKESFATPYWLVEGFGYDPKQPDLGLVPALAANSGDSAAYRSVIIRPGLWWKFAEMSEKRYPLPASILRLPTDGRGRERERYALLISTFLALHVRRNQRQHAGKAVILKTGTLLEEAGITTWEEFDQMHPTQASRMRDHLHHSSEETGVFPLLRELEAFDIQVADQRAFYASGRGWKSKFWDSRLEIAVPDLEIVKRKK